MLILPPGHGEMLRTRPALGRWEKRAVLVVATLAAALVVVAIVAVSSSAPPVARGCLYATVPGFIGATEFHQCGRAARQVCLSAGPRDGLSAYGTRLLDGACRKAGLPLSTAVATP